MRRNTSNIYLLFGLCPMKTRTKQKSKQTEEHFEKVVEYTNGYQDQYLLSNFLIFGIVFADIMTFVFPVWGLIFSFLFGIWSFLINKFVGRKVYWRKIK